MKAFSLASRGTTAKEALREAVMLLQRAHIETASLDARILLEYVLQVSRERLLLMLDEPMNARQEESYRDIVARRARRQPVAQLIGRREFWGMDFAVTSDTLDPRPDSETLIDALIKRFADRDGELNILDLGTGTGCLLLSLLKEFKNASGIGVDISEAALKVARENAKAHGLTFRTRFLQSDWCREVKQQYDIVISNPPYIASGDIAGLMPEVAEFEPKQALDGGADGLDAYRVIVAALPGILAPTGIAAFEIGAGQQAALEELAAKHGLVTLGTRTDINGITRCILLTHRNS